MRIEDPFHEGELRVQKLAGELEEGVRNGRVLADSIMKGALKFVAQQPMVVLGPREAGEEMPRVPARSSRALTSSQSTTLNAN